jgi:hypothetical protein
MNRLLILACSQTKRKDSGRLSGRDRYDGPLWRDLRKHDPEGRLAKVAFLSAQDGFRDACWPVDFYDRRMTPEIAQQMIAGGLGALWPRLKPGVAGGMAAGAHIASMSDWGRKPLDEVCIVGGHLYIDVMRHYVSLFRAGGHLTKDAPLVEINGQIGYMRRDMRVWLTKDYRGDGAGLAESSSSERAQATESANANSCDTSRYEFEA